MEDLSGWSCGRCIRKVDFHAVNGLIADFAEGRRRSGKSRFSPMPLLKRDAVFFASFFPLPCDKNGVSLFVRAIGYIDLDIQEDFAIGCQSWKRLENG